MNEILPEIDEVASFWCAFLLLFIGGVSTPKQEVDDCLKQ
jgi:hypothetical protein